MGVKVYRVTLLVVDHDELGGPQIASVLEDQRYPNWCIAPTPLKVEEADIGEWTDGHPLNMIGTDEGTYCEGLDWKEV